MAFLIQKTHNERKIAAKVQDNMGNPLAGKISKTWNIPCNYPEKE